MTTINLTGDIPLTFIHIPKTGGTSVEAWFFENEFILQKKYSNFNMEYITDHPSLPMIQEKANVVKSFSIVRNPWARVVSGYFYSCAFPRFFIHNGLKELPTWDEYIDRIDSWQHFDWYELTTNQYEWIPDGVDILLRTETLNADFKQIQDMYGIDKALRNINTTVHSDYKDYYNDASKSKIARIFEQDIDLFKYTFEN
jgi:hypothetical protein